MIKVSKNDIKKISNLLKQAISPIEYFNPIKEKNLYDKALKLSKIEDVRFPLYMDNLHILYKEYLKAKKIYPELKAAEPKFTESQIFKEVKNLLQTKGYSV